MSEIPKFNAGIKEFAETAKEVGFTREERREIFNALKKISFDSIKEVGHDNREFSRYSTYEKKANLLTGTESLYLSQDEVISFLRLLNGISDMKTGESKSGKDYVNIVKLAKKLIRYGSKSEESISGELNEQERKIISIAIKYIEKWFLDGDFTDFDEKDASGEYNHDLWSLNSRRLAVIAFLVNQLAKIKELPSNAKTIANFDKSKIEELIDLVNQSVTSLLPDPEQIDIKVVELKAKREVIEEQVRDLEQKILEKKKSISRLEYKITPDIDSMISVSKDLIRSLLNGDFGLSRDEILAIRYIGNTLEKVNEWTLKKGLLNGIPIVKQVEYEINEINKDKRQNEIDEEIKLYKKNIEILKKTLERFRQLGKSHDSEPRKPSKVFTSFGGLDSLNLEKGSDIKNSTVIRVLSSILESFNNPLMKEFWKLSKDEEDLYNQQRKLKQITEPLNEELRLFAIERLVNGDIVKSKLEESISSLRGDFNGPASDLYLVKTCLIGTEKNRRNNTGMIYHHFLPDISDNSQNRQMPVFDFADQMDPQGKTYHELHYKREHLLACQFIAEYLRRNRVK